MTAVSAAAMHGISEVEEEMALKQIQHIGKGGGRKWQDSRQHVKHTMYIQLYMYEENSWGTPQTFFGDFRPSYTNNYIFSVGSHCQDIVTFYIISTPLSLSCMCNSCALVYDWFTTKHARSF